MTASELQDLIVARLAKLHGGTQRHWRIALGTIEVRDPALYPHCNWLARPSGGTREVAAIETLLDDVRLSVPIVSG